MTEIVDALADNLNRVQRERDEALAAVERLTAERDQARRAEALCEKHDERNRADIATLVAERDSARAQRDGWVRDFNQLRGELAAAERARDTAETRLGDAIQALTVRAERAEAERDAMRPVVEAAVNYIREPEGSGYETESFNDLIAAVDAYTAGQVEVPAKRAMSASMAGKVRVEPDNPRYCPMRFRHGAHDYSYRYRRLGEDVIGRYYCDGNPLTDATQPAEATTDPEGGTDGD